MRAPLIRILVTIPLCTLVGAQKTYNLKDRYSGKDFFQWNFFEGPDPTNGNVNYLGMQDAQSQGLAYADTDNTFVTSVDFKSDVPAGGKRNSVRIQSPNTYDTGLFVLDAIQMPVGCGTWPAFWSTNAYVEWPYGGEIDIAEGTNSRSQNQMTWHTGALFPCTLDVTGNYTGHTLHTDCSQKPDAGCSILDSDTTSFGDRFNEVGGGVFVMEWDKEKGISIWHFQHKNIPGDLTNNTPTPADWPAPAGFLSARTCDISDNFFNHVMIMDTTICGWAASTFKHSNCPGTCADMVANKTNFENAQWKIIYVAVYQ